MKLRGKQENTIFHHAFHATLAERYGDDSAYRKHSGRLITMLERLGEEDKKKAVRIVERAIREAMKR